jgi:hypothetical protein
MTKLVDWIKEFGFRTLACTERRAGDAAVRVTKRMDVV